MDKPLGPEPKPEPLKLESWQTPVPFHKKPGTPPPPSRQPQKAKVPGCLIAIIVIVVLIAGFSLVGSVIQSATDPRKNPSETWSNGKATCERMIEEEEGQRARSDRSDVFEPSIHTYKLQTWVQYHPENKLYTCRLIWNGSSWDTDLFEYTE